jgi:hypothetical protein
MTQDVVQNASPDGVPRVDWEMEARIKAAKGKGEPLSEDVRGQMEPAFGADFTGVRVHTDGEAHGLSESLQARAFTTGQDIFFKSGEYDPGSPPGQELLAHELAHTVQQGARGQIARKNGDPGKGGEEGEPEKAKQGKPEEPVALPEGDKAKIIKEVIPKAVGRLKSEAEVEKQLQVREDSEKRLKEVVEAAELRAEVQGAQLKDPRVSAHAKLAAKAEVGLPEPDEDDEFFFEFGEELEAPEGPGPAQAAAPLAARPRRPIRLPKPQTEAPSTVAEVGEAVVAGAEYGAEIGQGVGMAEVGAEAFGRTATGQGLNVLSHVLGAVGAFFSVLFGFLDIRALWRTGKRIDALKEAREAARRELRLAGADADANELVEAIDYAISQKYKKVKRRVIGLLATLLTGATGIAFWAAGGVATVFAASNPVGWAIALGLLGAGIVAGLGLLGYRIIRAIWKRRQRGQERKRYARTILDHALGEGSAHQVSKLRPVARSAIDSLKIRKERGFKGWIKGLFRKGPLLAATEMIYQVNTADADQKEAVKDRCAALIASKLRSG